MQKRSMPQARSLERPQGLQWEVAPKALERWTPDLNAAESPSDATISILDVIGLDPWTGDGVTAKRIASALRSIGADKDVTVLLNSPGGDLFEGIAIYNMLQEHKGLVTIKVIGMAASAASLIAMAGDQVLIARSGFLMIHDTWVVAVGNRNDLRDVADTLEPFDAAMADIYAARTGIDAAKVQKMMDNETWIGGSAAVEQGFADALLSADEVKKDASLREDRIAAYLIDAKMREAGAPRSERRRLLNEFKASVLQSAGGEKVVTRDADDNGTLQSAATKDLCSLLQGFNLKQLLEGTENAEG